MSHGTRRAGTAVGVAGVVLSGLLCGHASAAAVLVYNFNDAVNNTTTVSTGTQAGTLTFQNSAAVATNLHGAAGSGASGSLGDLAFDNTASTGMGNAGTGGRAVDSPNGNAASTALNTAIAASKVLTISGWYKSSTTPGGNARLVEFGDGVSNSMYVLFDGSNANQMRLGVNGVNANSIADTSYTQTNKWIFFAVSYNGANGATSFYKGDATTPVSLVSSTTLAGGNPVAFSYLNIGNGLAGSGGTTRPFDGYLDNFRFDDTLLNTSALETVRQGAVPEPAALSLAGLAGVALLTRRRR